MAAILVMWHKPFVLTFILSSYGSSRQNLAFFMVSNEKKFENVDSE